MGKESVQSETGDYNVDKENVLEEEDVGEDSSSVA